MPKSQDNFIKTTFECSISKIANAEMEDLVAKASLEELKTLFPNEVNLNINKDLIGLVLNAAVAGRCNKNGDAITKKDALSIAENFRYKYVNVEHNQSKIIGCILNVGYSKFGTNELLTKEQVKDENFNEPFNISLAVIVYKSILSDESIEFIESAADESSDNYGKVSASWELMFRGYDIAVGSSKNISDAKIITDEKQAEKLEKHLKKNKGSGKINNEYVYRVLAGEYMIPAGIGLVEFPAAEVNGIALITQNNENSEKNEENMKNKAEIIELVKSTVEEIINTAKKVMGNCPDCGEESEMEEMDDEEEMSCSKCEKKNKAAKWKMSKSTQINDKNDKNEEKISISSKTDVTPINSNNNISKINMKIVIKDLNEVNKELFEKVEASEVQASIKDFLTSQIEAGAKQWEAEKKTKEEALQKAEAAIKANEEKAKKEYQDLQDNFSAIEKQYKELNDKVLAAELEQKFAQRISGFETEFELSEDVRKVVAGEIKGMKDEDFDKYLGRMKVLLPKKQAKTVASEVSTASEIKEVVTDAVETAEVVTAQVPNTTSTESNLSLLDRMKKNFKIEIVPSKR